MNNDILYDLLIMSLDLFHCKMCTVLFKLNKFKLKIVNFLVGFLIFHNCEVVKNKKNILDEPVKCILNVNFIQPSLVVGHFFK